MRSFLDLIKHNIDSSSRRLEDDSKRGIMAVVRGAMEEGGENSSSSSSSNSNSNSNSNSSSSSNSNSNCNSNSNSNSSIVTLDSLQRDLQVGSEAFEPLLRFSDCLHIPRLNINNHMFAQRKQE